MKIKFIVSPNAMGETDSSTETFVASVLSRLPQQDWGVLSALVLAWRGEAPSCAEQEEGRVWVQVPVPALWDGRKGKKARPVRVRLWVD